MNNVPATFFASMPDVGFIEVAGPDARSFLQNLGTNDLRPLAVNEGCEVFFTTHKARIVAHAVVHCLRDDAFLLGVESHRAEALYKHLDHYLISEQVELTARGDAWTMVRLLGPESQRWAEIVTGASIGDWKPWQGIPIDEVTGAFVRRQGALFPVGFDIVGPSEWIVDLTNKLTSQGLALAETGVLEAFRIESGWPKWGHEMDENRFVVELGRTASAISYGKGCYLGQEPIVMARDRGQVNRQLMGFRCAGEVSVPVGSKVMVGEVEQLKVTSATFSPGWNRTVGLAYVYRGHQTPGTILTIPTPSGDVAATLSSLPMLPG
jgi:folate-binding protein YgfZ